MNGATRAGFYRVRTPEEIRVIRRRGRRAHGTYVTVWRLASSGESQGKPAALGIVTSRGHRSAVRRNRARRRVLGCIMDIRENLLPGFEYLVEARPGVDEVDYQLLVKDVEDVFSRISKT